MKKSWMGLSSTCIPGQSVARRNPWLRTIIGLLLLSLAGCGQSYTFHGTTYEPPLAAPNLAGINWDGSPFQLKEQQGKVAVIFFGYTHCPDTCPLTLAHLAQIYPKLGEKAAQLAVIFVSVDPARDTPERLAEYIPAFQKAFYGLHIPAAQLEPIKKAFGVYAEPAQTGATSQDSLVAHSEYLFIVDQTGNLRVLLPATIPPEELQADLEHLLQS